MYYNPRIIVNKIEQALKMNFYEICHYIVEANVSLTPETISKNMQDKYLNEKPGDEERLKKLRKMLYKGFKKREDFTLEYKLQLETANYFFNPDTLNYFINYISVLKIKCNNIIKIIDGLLENNLSEDVLNELDIKLDKKGNILMSDITRLTEPLIYNFKKLKYIVDKANNIETYAKFKVSLDKVSNEDELYPSDELQNSNYEIDGEEGFIPFTKHQKKLLKTKEKEIVSSLCDVSRL